MIFWAPESEPGYHTLLINQEMWEAADSFDRSDAFILALFFAVLRNQGDYYYDGLFDVWVARLAGQTYVEKDPMQIMLATPAEMGWTGRRMN